MDGIELEPSTVPMCAKTYKLIVLLLASSATASFPQLLRCKANIVASYHKVSYLQHRYDWIVTSNAVHNYWKCYINVVTWTCSGFYWYICTLSWTSHALVSHAYISLNLPLSCYNILMHVCMYIHMYTCMHVCMYIFMYCIYPNKSRAQCDWICETVLNGTRIEIKFIAEY